MSQALFPASYPALKTVVLNGSLHKPSRTQVLLDHVGNALARHVALDRQSIELADIATEVGSALYPQQLPARAREAVAAIEAAEFLIVGSPVYRGSVPGLFKHLLDLIGMESLVGKPVLLAATGGSPRHSLVLDHQLRPLFAFFQTLTLPIGVYSVSQDIDNGQIVDAALRERVELAATLAAPALQGLVQRKAGLPPSAAV